MRIKSVGLKNFKRFTDLNIDGIPSTAKLVLVVGPNGCGKSSLFDAFMQWFHRTSGLGQQTDNVYYRKDFQTGDTVHVSLHDDTQGVPRGSIYVRTAYRNEPDFSINSIQRQDNPAHTARIGRSIQNDQVVADNYGRLVYETASGVYDDANRPKLVGALRDELIGEIQQSMRNVFGDLLLNNISDPLAHGSNSFFFQKGTAKSYHYKNLSGGEKAAFDLLLDMHVKKKYFKNSIYCIDEVETHLHTSVQGKLLKELVSTLPGESQLWIATHSLVQFARPKS